MKWKYKDSGDKAGERGVRNVNRKRGNGSCRAPSAGWPIAISHPFFSFFSPLTSDSSCNHYVTYPSNFSLSHFSHPPPADIALRLYLVRVTVSPSRAGMVRLLLHGVYYLILKPFLFPLARHFAPKCSAGFHLFLLRSALGCYFIPATTSVFPYSPLSLPLFLSNIGPNFLEILFQRF